jgi:uncharacterized protein YnzC (UPF0291/DUF896 family)
VVISNVWRDSSKVRCQDRDTTATLKERREKKKKKKMRTKFSSWFRMRMYALMSIEIADEVGKYLHPKLKRQLREKKNGSS